MLLVSRRKGVGLLQRITVGTVVDLVEPDALDLGNVGRSVATHVGHMHVVDPAHVAQPVTVEGKLLQVVLLLPHDPLDLHLGPVWIHAVHEHHPLADWRHGSGHAHGPHAHAEVDGSNVVHGHVDQHRLCRLALYIHRRRVGKVPTRRVGRGQPLELDDAGRRYKGHDDRGEGLAGAPREVGEEDGTRLASHLEELAHILCVVGERAVAEASLLCPDGGGNILLLADDQTRHDDQRHLGVVAHGAEPALVLDDLAPVHPHLLHVLPGLGGELGVVLDDEVDPAGLVVKNVLEVLAAKAAVAENGDPEGGSVGCLGEDEGGLMLKGLLGGYDLARLCCVSDRDVADDR
mmetsp:Transcript_728/g.1909  ORF Transcript_728/g.1909 Transcript_728/m.1909 type:complete len:347 (-) Transcript_728:281-1321(-)